MNHTQRLMFFVLISATFCQASMLLCELDDEACLVSTANVMYSKIMAGDSTIGAEILDPVLFEEIDGSLSMLHYTFTNSTVTGYKNCRIKGFRIDMNQTKLKLNLRCPEINMTGFYSIDGRLIILPVVGQGKQSLSLYSFNINMEAEFKIVKTKDGKEYISIRNFDMDAEAEEGGKFKFYNLFNGQKDLSDAVLKFVNENSKEVAHEFQGPILITTFEKFVKNTNKFLKAMPMANLFVQ